MLRLLICVPEGSLKEKLKLTIFIVDNTLWMRFLFTGRLIRFRDGLLISSKTFKNVRTIYNNMSSVNCNSGSE